MEEKNFPYDLKEIKEQAEQSLSNGAVTGQYRLSVEIACQLLNAALASEIMCVLRYRRHQIIVKGIECMQIEEEFKEHAEQEEMHMLMLAERINQLGGTPDFNPASVAKNSSTEFGTATDMVGMLREDLVAERIAIEVYRKMIQWFGKGDPTTRRLLEEILEDEEDHANDLADLLADDQKNPSPLSLSKKNLRSEEKIRTQRH